METLGALIILDLEGVAGVDDVAALISGTPEHTLARQLVTAEVNATVEGLLAAGFTWVRVSDSHLSGSDEGLLLPEALHPAARPCLSEEDPYALEFFDQVSALACVGMHAAAGTRGFAAHTVDLLGAWTCDGQALSESRLVLALAAEAGVPVLFVSGDDVLEDSLAGGVEYVRTKHSHSPTQTTSRPPPEVLAELTRAAQRPPRPTTPLPDAPLVLTFKSQYQAELAASSGARRLGPYHVEVTGGSSRERYTQALRASAAAVTALPLGVRDEPGTPGFTRDIAALLCLSGPPTPPPPARTREAEAALQAFLRLSSETDDESRALRALTLHMLEGHAPRTFARWGLTPVLETALAALREVPLELPLTLIPDHGMARVDAWFILRERNLPHETLEPQALSAYVRHLDAKGDIIYAWLLGEMAALAGLDVRLPIPHRHLQDESRLADLYWLTHLCLLDTRYLRHAPRSPHWAAWLEELTVASPWLVEGGHVDLGAEVAFCLQCGKESAGGAHASLLALLAAHQQPSGDLGDAHATAAALLAFAGTEEHSSFPPEQPQTGTHLHQKR